MQLIELSECTMGNIGKNKGLECISFRLNQGEAWAIYSEDPFDAHLFLKLLATLSRPESGIYRFMGEKLNFSDYRNLLSVKKQIAYAASDSAMISNRTIRENLLFTRHYFENILSLKLEDHALELCRILGIDDKLDLRPASLDALDVRGAIFIRELLKSPKILLLERPEDLIAHTKYAGFRSILKSLLKTGVPAVFVSNDEEFVKSFAARNLMISNGKVLEFGS